MKNRKKRKWDEDSDDDPAAGLLNLFDVWIAFAAALLLAMVSYYHHSEPTKTAANANAQSSAKESIEQQALKMEHYRVSPDARGGDGERLGTAYRLKNGEIIYVPEAKR